MISLQHVKELKGRIKQTFSNLKTKEDGDFYLDEFSREVRSFFQQSFKTVTDGSVTIANRNPTGEMDLMSTLSKEYSKFLERLRNEKQENS